QGRLLIRGSASTGFTFEHADGTRYGADVDETKASIMTDAFDALRKLGYEHKVATDVLDDLRTHVGADDGGPIADAGEAVKLAVHILDRRADRERSRASAGSPQ